MSANITKPTAYAVFFYSTDGKLLAHWTSKNGNIVDLGRVCMSYLSHNLLPADAVKVVGELGIGEII